MGGEEGGYVRGQFFSFVIFFFGHTVHCNERQSTPGGLICFMMLQGVGGGDEDARGGMREVEVGVEED